MLTKTVRATLAIKDETITIDIVVSCNDSTPESELIRRAGNALRLAADEATYEICF